jgi:hypothetical protein
MAVLETFDDYLTLRIPRSRGAYVCHGPLHLRKVELRKMTLGELSLTDRPSHGLMEGRLSNGR